MRALFLFFERSPLMLIPFLVPVLVSICFAYLWRREAKFHALAQLRAACVTDLEQTLLEHQEKYLALHAEYIQTRTQREGLKQQLVERECFLHQAQERLSDTFRALSADALQNNHAAFLGLATATFEKWEHAAKGEFQQRHQAVDTMVGPLRESLERVHQKMGELEQTRHTTQQLFQEQVRLITTSQAQLQMETANLVKALRMPQVRGRWGEMQLKRVVEMAGMLEHCDFTEQMVLQAEEGKQRPDMTIHLPNGKRIVVDAKTPLQAYLASIESTDEETRLQHLRQHARQVRTHVSQLSAKAYWESLPATPEFVVLFLPGEPFFSAALEQDPLLIEYGVENRVIIATPTTLIALLRSVAYGWRQEQVTEHAQKISALGKMLYDRLHLLCDHFVQMRKGLDRTVESYNSAVGCFETRVLVTARKMRETQAFTGEEISSLDPCDKRTRSLSTSAPSDSLSPLNAIVEEHDVQQDVHA